VLVTARCGWESQIKYRPCQPAPGIRGGESGRTIQKPCCLLSCVSRKVENISYSFELTTIPLLPRASLCIKTATREKLLFTHAIQPASQPASERRLDKPPKRGHAPPSPILLQGGSRVSCTTVLTSAYSEGAESLPRQKSSQGWTHSSRAAGGTLLLTTCNHQLCSKQP